MTRRQASGSESTNGPPMATPALATTTSTLPNRSFTSRATCAIASWSVTSAYQWPLSRVQPLGDLLQLVRLQADQRQLGTARGELAGEQLAHARAPRR